MAAPGDHTVAVVGAGLSGLTAGYRLARSGWRVTVLESEPVLGGRVQTVERDGFLLDTGATALAETYDAYLSLAEALGIRDEIVPASPVIGIYRDGTIHHLQLDHVVSSGVRTRLLSTRAKVRALRLALDVGRAKLQGRLDYSDMRKSAPLDTESAAGYARRALGPELAEYVCQPVVRMMLIADGDEVSVVELFSGLANIFSSRICSLRGGQGRMPRLLAEGLDVRLRCRVELVQDAGERVGVTWRTADGAAQAESFDACVIAAPLHVAAGICPDRQSVLGGLDRAMSYTRCLSVAVATRVRPRSPAFVVEMPPAEDASVALMFLNHNKCEDRAPPGDGTARIV